MLLLTLTACAGKDDAPIDDAAAENPASEDAVPAETAPAEQAQTDETAAKKKSIAEEEAQIGPIGNIRLADGSALELTKFEKIGKYYIYISGKLNGRSSTVVSFTRLSDLKHFASIRFKDQHTFTIITKGEKELHFADSRVYIGSDSPTTYTFHTTRPDSYKTELIEVNKADVKEIIID